MMNTRSRTVSQSNDRSASDAVSPWRHLLIIDSAAGASVGVFMLAAHTLLSSWYGLPASLLIGTGLVNLAYAACSGTLSRLRVRPTRLVVAMALANVAWSPVCLLLAWYNRETATPLGLAALLSEAAFVATLGVLEWRHRLLLTKSEPSGQVPPNHS
jgi:hypothetical protein